jgi:hypothetical protein
MSRGLRASLRARPELLFAPLACLLILFNVGPWGYGPTYIATFALYFSLQRSNEIFPLTWTLCVATFASTLWLLVRSKLLTLWRDLLVAGSVPFLAVSLFEIPYEVAYGVTHPGTITLFEVVSMATWLAVGVTSVGWWRVSSRFSLLAMGVISGFVVWYAIGFPTIDRATGASFDVALVFNLILKIAVFPLAALPVWDGILAAWRESLNATSGGLPGKGTEPLQPKSRVGSEWAQ